MARSRGTKRVNSVSPFIEGMPRPSESEDAVELRNPATGESSIVIPAGCQEDVERAVASARKSFDDGRWSDLGPSKRKAILFKFADAIQANAHCLDSLDAMDMGKPLSLQRANAAAAAHLVRFHADAIDKIFGDVYQSDKFTFVTQRRIPRGVIAAVVPWNFPTMNAATKFAPALAAGNSVVLKPSEWSPRSAMLLMELAIKSGLPPGVLNMVPGRGERVGRALGLHQGVDMVTFTGSTEVGKLMVQYSGQSNMKVIHSECGGKSPHIVFGDFEDLDTLSEHVALGILVNQGQLCVAGSRLIVHESIEAELVAKVVTRLKDIKAGDPLHPETTYGPLVNEAQLERVMKYISIGRKEGAELVLGGNQILQESGGYFIEPTLFKDVPPHASITQNEIFGPVLSVTSFTRVEEAIQLANATQYGLMAHVWTASLSTGMTVGKAINAGDVHVNSSAPEGEGAGLARSLEPFGESGIGVEGGVAGLEVYLRRQGLRFNH